MVPSWVGLLLLLPFGMLFSTLSGFAKQGKMCGEDPLHLFTLRVSAPVSPASPCYALQYTHSTAQHWQIILRFDRCVAPWPFGMLSVRHSVHYSSVYWVGQ